MNYGFPEITGSGGGCFPEGTMVFTQAGWKPIQKIRVGDTVVAFDTTGHMEHASVTRTFIHEREENKAGLYEFTYIEGNNPDKEKKLTVTGNHAIYSKGSKVNEEDIAGHKLVVKPKEKTRIVKYRGERIRLKGNEIIERGIPKKKKPYKYRKLNDFKLAQDFKVGDTFFNHRRENCQIIDVKYTPYSKLPKNFKSYNLNVEPHHTFLVANKIECDGVPDYVGIRVHNGGGGKGGGSSARPTEEPNTISSVTKARIVHVISEGPIDGLVGDGQGILINSTPLVNTEGEFNFEGVSYDFRLGTPNQTYMPGFPEVESFFSVNTEATFGSPVEYQTTSTDIDALRIIVLFPDGLSFQDPESYDLRGYKVQIAFDARKAGSGDPWTQVYSETVSDKATSAFEKEYRIERPATATDSLWEVRLRRISEDDDGTNERSSTNFSSVTEIQDIKITYPDTAVVGMSIDAKATGGQIPQVGFLVRGLILEVPSNYDPVTREYTGIWNGTFKSAFSDSGPWFCYQLLKNTRWGYGKFGLPESMIDKWSFYDAGKYSDEFVDDGDGGTEPRYTANGSIVKGEQAWQAIQNVASNFNATIYPGGLIQCLQDRPSDPVKLVNNTNVVDGLFEYADAALDAIHTQVNITFNDKTNNYLPRTVSIENLEAIERYDYNPDDKVAILCTSEGQARRAARWQLDTELNQQEIISYTTSFHNANLQPYDVYYLVDNDRAGTYVGGRVAGGTGTSVLLDREVTLESGATYTLLMMDVDGVGVIEKEITNPQGTTDVLYFDGLLSDDYACSSASELVGRDWHIFSPDTVDKRLARLLGIEELEHGLYKHISIEYDPGKYDRVETGLVIPSNPFSVFQLEPAGPITDLTMEDEQYFDPVLGVRTGQRLTWSPPVNKIFVTGYHVRWNRDNLGWNDPVFTPKPEYLITETGNGIWEVDVVALVRGIND